MAPIIMLMLFVFSAGMTATLVLGRPVIWYLDGKKKESIQLLLSTLFAFFILTVLAFFIFIATV